MPLYETCLSDSAGVIGGNDIKTINVGQPGLHKMCLGARMQVACQLWYTVLALCRHHDLCQVAVLFVDCAVLEYVRLV